MNIRRFLIASAFALLGVAALKADPKKPLKDYQLQNALDGNNQLITNLAAPSSANDAARKAYVDAGLRDPGTGAVLFYGNGTNEITVADGVYLTFENPADAIPWRGAFGWSGAGNLTLGGNFTTSGSGAVTFTISGATNLTLPTSGTLETVAGTSAAIVAERTATRTLTGATINGGNNTLTVLGASQISGTIPTGNLPMATQAQAKAATSTATTLSPATAKNQFDQFAGIVPATSEITLRDFHRKIQLRMDGGTGQVVIAFIGDSWTAACAQISLQEGYVAKVTRELKKRFGDAGPGWVGFGSNQAGTLNGAAEDAMVTVTRGGTWSSGTFATATSPDLSQAVSSTVNSNIIVSWLPSQKVETIVVHYLKQSGGGDFKYRWTTGQVTGSYTVVSTANASTVYATSTLTAPAGAEKIEFVIDTAGTGVTLYGADLRNSNPGIRVHKLGQPATRASQWAAVDATRFNAGLTALGADFTSVLFGTNDQGNNDSPSGGYSPALGTIVDRIRDVRAGADVVVAVPFENLAGRSIPMTDYAAAARDLAATKRAAFLNFTDYGATSSFDDASPRVLISSGDVYHPTALGFAQIASDYMRLLAPPGAERCLAARSLDPAAVTGTELIYDFGTALSYPSRSTPVAGAVVLDRSGNGRDTIIKGSGSASFTGGGLNFDSATAPFWCEVPTSALAPLAANNEYLLLFYVRLPDSGDWYTGGAARLFIDFSGNNNITNTGLKGLVGLAQTYTSSAPSLTCYRYIGTSLDSFTVLNANLSAFLGTVTQIAVWRTGSEYAVQLRNSSGSYKQAAGSLGSPNASIGANGNFGNLGLQWDSTYRPSGSQTKFRIYRCVIENLATSGRDPAVAADADWASKFGPN